MNPEADPPELAELCAGLRAAYPAGLARTDAEYSAVVALVAAICSNRQAASVLVRALGIDWGTAYNDVLGAGTQGSAGPAWDSMISRLEPLGLRSWLDEEDLRTVFPLEPHSPSPIRITCDTIAYRRGFVEVANIHPRCVNLAAWDVSTEWPHPLSTILELSDGAVLANTELELTVTQARQLAAALLAAADFAAGEASTASDPSEAGNEA